MLQMNPPLVNQSYYRKLPLIDPAIYYPLLPPPCSYRLIYLQNIYDYHYHL